MNSILYRHIHPSNAISSRTDFHRSIPSRQSTVAIIIPALNEEDAIGKVIRDIPRDIVNEIIVVDNNSTDNTAQVARKAGVTVLYEQQRGYGAACQKGIEYLKMKPLPPDIVVFLDADYSDFPEEIIELIQPIINNVADFVIGSRLLGNREKGALLPQQIFGNWLATRLLHILYHVHYTDLGPFRAIRFTKLMVLKMEDKTYGWTVEMQLKAAQHKLRYTEIPVRYRKRIGVSKIAGTFQGTIMAGYKIISTIFKYVFS